MKFLLGSKFKEGLKMRVSLYLLPGITFLIISFAGAVPASSEEKMPPWQEEFEEICSMVQAGDALTKEELNELIERADKLMEEIKKLDIPSKKVYLFRLKKCRKFFEYILELKETEKISLLSPV